ARLGSQKMMVFLPASSALAKDEQRKIARDRLAAISEVLQKSHLRLGIEFLGVLQFRTARPDGPPMNPFIWNLPDAVALAKDSGPNIGVILDVWHWHHSGSTLDDILAAGKERLLHIHVSAATQQIPV